MPDTRQTSVMERVRARIERDPNVTNQELYEMAVEIDPSIEELTLRQFHARFPLQVKRQRAAADELARLQGGAPPREEIDREGVRRALVRFARDLTAASGTPRMVDLLTEVDSYVDEIVDAVARGEGENGAGEAGNGRSDGSGRGEAASGSGA